MAIPATAVWEVRANAANSGLQGGFFNSALGGTDYSQQDSPQLSLTDLATDAAGTGISSATGGFTAAMAGNGIYITGGSTTAGWYEITAVTDTNNATIDRSAGESKAGATGRVGGAAFLADASLKACVDGNVVNVAADGQYNIATISLATTAPSSGILIRGYATTPGDSPTGANRPLVACGAKTITLATGWSVANLRFTGSSTTVVQLRNGCAHNCSIVNNSTTAGRYACNQSSYVATFVGCEISSLNGSGILEATWCTLIGCCIHDCADVGAQISGAVIRCLFHLCGTGLKAYSSSVRTITYGSVFYDCTTGIDLNAGVGNVCVNSIIAECTNGATSADSEAALQWFDANNWHANTADVNNVAKGLTALALDPQFVDASNGDFETQNAGLRGAAFPSSLPGLATVNYEDIGFQIEATGGGGTRGFASFG